MSPAELGPHQERQMQAANSSRHRTAEQ